MRKILFLITILLICLSCKSFDTKIEYSINNIINNPSTFKEFMHDTSVIFKEGIELIPEWKIDFVVNILIEYKNNKYKLYDYQSNIDLENAMWVIYDFDVPDSDKLITLMFELLQDIKTKSWKVFSFNIDINSYPNLKK